MFQYLLHHPIVEIWPGRRERERKQAINVVQPDLLNMQKEKCAEKERKKCAN
jgi:hypothetical protein